MKCYYGGKSHHYWSIINPFFCILTYTSDNSEMPFVNIKKTFIYNEHAKCESFSPIFSFFIQKTVNIHLILHFFTAVMGLMFYFCLTWLLTGYFAYYKNRWWIYSMFKQKHSLLFVRSTDCRPAPSSELTPGTLAGTSLSKRGLTRSHTCNRWSEEMCRYNLTYTHNHKHVLGQMELFNNILFYTMFNPLNYCVAIVYA